MRAHIIAIGNELLFGETLDTNSHWLAGRLTDIGLRVDGISVIADRRDAILETLRLSQNQADFVFITGGLGPTSDDITKETLAFFFQRDLVLDTSVLADIEAFLRRRGIFSLNERNRGQALVLSECEVIPNAIGTAPGLWIERDGTVFVAMPGVPFEMREMMAYSVIPRIQRTRPIRHIVRKTVLTTGIPESQLAIMISDWEAGLGEASALAYLPSPGMVKLRLSAEGPDREALEARIASEVKSLRALIPDEIFGYDDDKIEGVIGRLLRRAGATLATAESCTGGAIARLITAVPGASDYFLGSIVAYANAIKIEALGVPSELIEAHGAVSREVVEKMAEGALTRFEADYAVATSGIAGPSGGTEEKPVGTTWVAAASQNKTVSKKFAFGETRSINIDKSAFAALEMLRRLMVKEQEGRVPIAEVPHDR